MKSITVRDVLHEVRLSGSERVSVQARLELPELKIVFMRGKQRFEIKRESSEDDSLFVGYLDGGRSVTGARADIVARALIKKHIVGLPDAQVLQFPLKTALQHEQDICSDSEPELAG